MNRLEARRKMLAAFDDVAKGAILLIITAVATRLVDDGYDKFIVARRYANLNEAPDVEA